MAHKCSYEDYMRPADESLRCRVCDSIFKDPVITANGHHFCHECLERLRREKRNCEQCLNENIPATFQCSELALSKKDTAVEPRIQLARVYCKLCGRQATYKNMKVHHKYFHHIQE